MIMMKRLPLFLLLFILSACSGLSQPKIEISNIKILEAKVSGITAADLNFRCICDVSEIQTTTPVFLTIQNKGAQPDRLLSAAADKAFKVELRDSGNAGSLITGSKLIDSMDIPPFSEVKFGDGKYLMILTGISEDIRPGDKVKVTLVFDKSGEIEVEGVAIPRE